MTVQRIRDEQAYREALRTVSALVDLDQAPGSPARRLEALASLVEQYEAQFMPEVVSGKLPGPST
jgi:HTH-type transcriptional regulator/antitoxin HigA